MARNAVSIAPAAPAAPMQVGEGYWQIAWRRLRKHHLAMGGLFVIALLIRGAGLAPWVTTYRFAPPFRAGHFLGTDDLGHDVLTRLLYAGRVSMLVGFAAALSAVALGTMVGVVAGFYGGIGDHLLMRLTDRLPTLPVLRALA